MNTSGTKPNLCLLILLFLVIKVNAQSSPSKYAIVPVRQQRWSDGDRQHWYDMMNKKGMGYSRSIYTRPELQRLQNHLNSFNPVTEITFTLDTAGMVCLQIHNLAGKCIRRC